MQQTNPPTLIGASAAAAAAAATQTRPAAAALPAPPVSSSAGGRASVEFGGPAGRGIGLPPRPRLTRVGVCGRASQRRVAHKSGRPAGTQSVTQISLARQPAGRQSQPGELLIRAPSNKHSHQAPLGWASACSPLKAPTQPERHLSNFRPKWRALACRRARDGSSYYYYHFQST